MPLQAAGKGLDPHIILGVWDPQLGSVAAGAAQTRGRKVALTMAGCDLVVHRPREVQTQEHQAQNGLDETFKTISFQHPAMGRDIFH